MIKRIEKERETIRRERTKEEAFGGGTRLGRRRTDHQVEEEEKKGVQRSSPALSIHHFGMHSR